MAQPDQRHDGSDRMARRLPRHLGAGALIGGVSGALLGMVVGLAWSSPSATPFWMAIVGLSIFGLAFGGLMGGYGSLESPDPGREPSDTERPIADRPQLMREEHEAQ